MKATRIATVVTLLVIAAACAPRFKGNGELVPQAQTAAGGADTGSDTPVDDTSSQTTAAPASVRGVPGATAKAAAKPVRVSTAGQSVVKRGGELKVGGLFPLSGGLSALGTVPFQAADAYFRHLNDAGGIDGIKIKFIPCDDQGDDTRSTTCGKQLIEQQGVFMMGPSFTPFSLTVIGVVQQEGVPWVGFDGINIEGFDAPNIVTVGAPIQPLAHGLVSWWYRAKEKELGHPPSKIGAVVLDVAPAQTYIKEMKNVICPKLGCQITLEKPVNFQTTEYGTICDNFRNARVDSVWIITDPASAVKLLVSCREAQYKPPAGWLGQHGIYIDLTLDQSGAIADGMIANSGLLPDSVDAPPVNEMKQIVKTYYSDATFGYFATVGYASARLVEDVVREALKDGGDLTRDKVLAAAARMTAYSCHGLCQAVNLAPPASRTGGNHSLWIVQAVKGHWQYLAGPLDAWQSETWPRPGRP